MPSMHTMRTARCIVSTNGPLESHLDFTLDGRCVATLPDDVAAQLAAVAAMEPVLDPLPEWPVYRGEYERLLERHGSVANQHSGPAYAVPVDHMRTPCSTSGTGRLMDASSARSLARYLPEWVEDTKHRSPFVGVVGEDGEVVALCASVRQTPTRPVWRPQEDFVDVVMGSRQSNSGSIKFSCYLLGAFPCTAPRGII